MSAYIKPDMATEATPAAQAAKIAELEEELRECKNELENCCYRDRVAKEEIVDWQKETQKARFDLTECQARIEQYEKDVRVKSLKAAKREALLEAADWFADEDHHGHPEFVLRSMAEELKG